MKIEKYFLLLLIVIISCFLQAQPFIDLSTCSTTPISFSELLSTATFGARVESGDVDGDGDEDLVLLARDSFFLFANDGNGILTQVDETNSPFANINAYFNRDIFTGYRIPIDFSLGDLNNDGVADFAYTEQLSFPPNFFDFFHWPYIFFNQLDGDITSNGTSPNTFGLDTPQITIGDYDNDNDGDVFVFDAGLAGIYTGGDFIALFGDDYPLTLLPDGMEFYPNSSTLFRDLNGDGNADAVVPTSDGFQYFLGDGNNSFTQQFGTNFPWNGFEPTRIFSADFTSSGTPNLYLTYRSGNNGDPEIVCISSADLLILPVDFLYFSVESTGKYLRLSWATGTEFNNSHFEVQRSLNGTNFEAIGTIAGAGNSTAENNYSFTDEQAVAGQTYFYRLAQVDFDGTRSYSEIKTGSVSSLANSGVSVYPNPATSTLTVALPEDGAGKRQVELVNAIGQTVLSLRQAPNTAGEMELDVSSVALGFYTVKVWDEQGTRGVPVVIEH